MMRKLICAFLSLLLLFTLCAPLTALADDPGSAPTIEKPVYVDIYDELGAPVSGATVQVLDGSGQVVESWTSGSSAHTVFLPAGEYTLKLADVPEGYLIDQDETPITVTLEEAELRTDFVGECVTDHSHPNVCSNPNHIGLETYSVHDSEGTVTAYCFNQNYDNPDSASRYRRLVGTPELLYELAQNKNGSVGPQELYDHVLAIIYHSGEIQAKYGLDNVMTRYLANMAIKNFTDPTCFNTFDDEGNSMLARDENGKPIRDADGHYVFLPGGTVLGSIVNHARGDNGGQDVLPQEYRDAYHELISFTSHPSDYYLYIYYPDNFQPGNTNTYQCLLSVFTVEPIRTSLSVRTATRIEITKVWDDAEDQDGLRPTEAEFTAGLHLFADGAEVTELYADALTVTDNRDGIRPKSITVHLLADGSEVQTATVIPDNAGNWAFAFEDLPKFDKGREIEYSITEEPVDKYTSEVEDFTIVNTHPPEKTRIEITKTWDDDDDRDGIRPKSITIHLLANGTEVQTATVTPDSEGNWAYAFEDLPKNEGGKEIEYTITEDPIKGYETTVTDFSIVNKHTPETIRIPVTKAWGDGNNKAGKRPTSITIHLLADGKVIETVTITPDDKGNWGHTFEDLPKYNKGKIIKYTIKEDPVTGYYTSITPSADGVLIRNSTTPLTGDDSRPGLWLALFGGSLLALGAALFFLLRKRRAE